MPCHTKNLNSLTDFRAAPRYSSLTYLQQLASKWTKAAKLRSGRMKMILGYLKISVGSRIFVQHGHGVRQSKQTAVQTGRTLSLQPLSGSLNTDF